ncbi:uncharacterized protein SCHCODRAFT_02673190 [Schizophyllum commune H4-8]|uniref:uncharacterized protein n=1 Tax=Schizophyllum commune (strain H4-8 / FGSC 9210) TaxID=578458 RepID=UPI00215DFF7B|nr:uncharacterized protein SCHCODRAFT_02673190 [Schizophyllum commune H4-8]KAI5886161.1 hypothetical protein SCHCODRAFT_02673190 [Schizophyllum commune H4-8]
MFQSTTDARSLAERQYWRQDVFHRLLHIFGATWLPSAAAGLSEFDLVFTSTSAADRQLSLDDLPHIKRHRLPRPSTSHSARSAHAAVARSIDANRDASDAIDGQAHDFPQRRTPFGCPCAHRASIKDPQTPRLRCMLGANHVSTMQYAEELAAAKRRERKLHTSRRTRREAASRRLSDERAGRLAPPLALFIRAYPDDARGNAVGSKSTCAMVQDLADRPTAVGVRGQSSRHKDGREISPPRTLSLRCRPNLAGGETMPKTGDHGQMSPRSFRHHRRRRNRGLSPDPKRVPPPRSTSGLGVCRLGTRTASASTRTPAVSPTRRGMPDDVEIDADDIPVNPDIALERPRHGSPRTADGRGDYVAESRSRRGEAPPRRLTETTMLFPMPSSSPHAASRWTSDVRRMRLGRVDEFTDIRSPNGLPRYTSSSPHSTPLEAASTPILTRGEGMRRPRSSITAIPHHPTTPMPCQITRSALELWRMPVLPRSGSGVGKPDSNAKALHNTTGPLGNGAKAGAALKSSVKFSNTSPSPLVSTLPAAPSPARRRRAFDALRRGDSARYEEARGVSKLRWPSLSGFFGADSKREGERDSGEAFSALARTIWEGRRGEARRGEKEHGQRALPGALGARRATASKGGRLREMGE